ncbi:MAG: EF-P beta-lysylation protein EpmB [Proteobacteria bacterium]|nr:MAG: EF-P beta-lysylation protein EpmB [Pseudomonadota bacterium]
MRAPCQTPLQQNLPSATGDYQQLRQRLALSELELPASGPAQGQFALKAPPAFVDRIKPGDADDPLLRQIWPAPEEEIEACGFVTDPVGDNAAITAPGLLQKYQGRALLIATSACAIHCRYCFRRHFPYGDHLTLDEDWAPALREITEDTSLNEIILSGGDPLTLSARRLQQLLDHLAAIPHLQRLRIHSRVPVVSPERITPDLETVLKSHPRPTVLVIHANHPAELDEAVHDTLWRLRRQGVTLLNQAVLLRGVNDCVETLQRLNERLFSCGVLPYYLHQLDPVAGAAHFAVDKARACALIKSLREHLPGYLVPRLVQELPGAAAKLPLID